jgi:hypothetical protein
LSTRPNSDLIDSRTATFLLGYAYASLVKMFHVFQDNMLVTSSGTEMCK